MLTTRTPEAHVWAVEQFKAFHSDDLFVPFKQTDSSASLRNDKQENRQPQQQVLRSGSSICFAAVFYG
jgi:hypothetical protein